MGKVVLTNRNNKKLITANKCDNIFSESLERKKALQLIKECVDRYLRNKLHNTLLYEAKKANANDANFEKGTIRTPLRLSLITFLMAGKADGWMSMKEVHSKY